MDSWVLRVLALSLLLPGVARGQQAREISEQYQFWGSVNGTIRRTDRFGAIADFHVRRNNLLANPSFYFARFGGRYWVTDGLTVPVSDDPKMPALALADEIAVQFGPPVVYNTFEQNRLFVGVRQVLSSSWSFDLGYMLVYQQKPTGYQYDLNHTLRWWFYFTPDLRKDEEELHAPPRERRVESPVGARRSPARRDLAGGLE